MGRASEVDTRPQTTNSDWRRVTIHINDNYCLNVAGDPVTLLNVTGNKQTFVDNLHVNLPVVNHVLIAGGQPQKTGIIPDIVQQKSVKYVKDISCVDHLSFVQNVPVVAIDRPVWIRLHQFWEVWAGLGASQKFTTVSPIPDPAKSDKFTHHHK